MNNKEYKFKYRKTQFTYIVNNKHRLFGNGASIWSIKEKGEKVCFKLSLRNDWFGHNNYWGILPNSRKIPIVLGSNATGVEIFIAKFVDSNNSNCWHGYPADYVSKTQDKPAFEVLKIWKENGYLSKSQILKINQGLRVKL